MHITIIQKLSILTKSNSVPEVENREILKISNSEDDSNTHVGQKCIQN
jgi:hypothetical protein